MKNNKKPIQGTREWAVAEINCTRGCPHGCLYCYARYDLVVRKGTITYGQWNNIEIDEEQLNRPFKKYSGQVMFPASHDIVSENLKECLVVLQNLLKIGNQVLVVSKPDLAIIKEMCTQLKRYKKQLLFRFTITARDNKILKIWEPYAPSYRERKQCLEYVFTHGFSSSVSVEPILDSKDVVEMVGELAPFVTHSIWLGKMNKIDQRVMADSEEIQKEILRIKTEQSDESIHQLYEELSSRKYIRWKESIKDIIGLPRASGPGLDV